MDFYLFIYLFIIIIIIFFCILFTADVLTKTAESSDDMSVPLIHGTSSTKGCVSSLEKVGEHSQHGVFMNQNMLAIYQFCLPVYK